MRIKEDGQGTVFFLVYFWRIWDNVRNILEE